jgi:hypothetical protein
VAVWGQGQTAPPTVSVSEIFRQSRTTSKVAGAHGDHLRKIPYTQKCMQVNRRNVIPVFRVTIIRLFLYTNLKHFLK